MELIQFSNFEKIATTFTAKDIARSDNLYFYDSIDVVGDFPEPSFYHDDISLGCWVVIIKDNNKISGYFTSKSNYDKVRFVNEEDDSILNVWGELVEPIPANLFLSSETPLLDVIAMFNIKDDFFLVLDKNAIIGTISFYDLDCNEVKLVIFSLILELDNALNELIRNNNISISKVLSKERIEKVQVFRAGDTFAKYRDLLYHLNMRDKFKLLKDADIFTFESKKEREKFIDKLLDVRNKIAHSETIISNPYIERINDGKEKRDMMPILGDRFRSIPEKILHDPETMKNFVFELRRVLNMAKSQI